MKLFKFIWELLNESMDYGDNMIYLWMKKRRLKRAIKIADKQSEINNGRRYYVLKHWKDPDKYMIRNKEQLRRMIRSGIIPTGTNFIDYLRESVYVTKLK